MTPAERKLLLLTARALESYFAYKNACMKMTDSEAGSLAYDLDQAAIAVESEQV